MTKDEKLKKALETLKNISDGTCEHVMAPTHAAVVYRHLTAPKMETVEVKLWLTEDGKVFLLESFASEHAVTLTTGTIIKLTGTYQRPVSEPEEEVWEGYLVSLPGGGVGLEYDGIIPDTLAGRSIEVRLREDK